MLSFLVDPVVQAVIPCAGPHPWVGDEPLRARLEDAGLRYAVLIGIIDSAENECSESTLAEDRKKYGHLIQKWKGWPLWDSTDASTFVAEVSGTSREVSAAWLNFDWNSGREV